MNSSDIALILDLDIGNTATKWRYGESTGDGDSVEFPNIQGPVERIRISNVAYGEDFISESAQREFGVVPEFARSVSKCGGVTNGYRDPSKLGIDRWLAVLAAWHQSRKACVVVDAGTALTIDVVDSDGQHLGGYIVPGIDMCLNALRKNTHNVRVYPMDYAPETRDLGLSTYEAGTQGIVSMLADLISKTHERYEKSLENEVRLWVCGGHAEFLIPWIPEHIHEPHLVLKGLPIALP